ncbi:MAG: hypothetical protein V3U52_05195 [Thermoplasmata archaeon]
MVRSLLSIALALLFIGAAAGQEISDPFYTNLLMGNFSTPQLAPGESGSLAFNLTNPYPWAINRTSLLVEIYAFRGSSGMMRVEDLESPPIFEVNVSRRATLNLGTIEEGETTEVKLTVMTTVDTPRGGFFTQGSYFIRFRLEFDYPQDQHAVMVSPGFFSEEEWAYALREPTPQERQVYRYIGNANYTYLGELLKLESIDGILPDSAFGVKKPLPLSPFYLILGGSGAAFLLSLYHLRRETREDSKPINRRQR